MRWSNVTVRQRHGERDGERMEHRQGDTREESSGWVSGSVVWVVTHSGSICQRLRAKFFSFFVNHIWLNHHIKCAAWFLFTFSLVWTIFALLEYRQREWITAKGLLQTFSHGNAHGKTVPPQKVLQWKSLLTLAANSREVHTNESLHNNDPLWKC